LDRGGPTSKLESAKTALLARYERALSDADVAFTGVVGQMAGETAAAVGVARASGTAARVDRNWDAAAFTQFKLEEKADAKIEAGLPKITAVEQAAQEADRIESMRVA